MGKTLKKLKIICFFIILLELILIAGFSVFYFADLFGFASKVDVKWVILGCVGLVGLNVLFIWLAILRVGSIRNKSDLKAAQVIGGDVQEAYNFAMVGLVVTNEKDNVLWTNELFRQRHIDIIDENIFDWQPDLSNLKDSGGSNETAKVVINNRNYEVKLIVEAGLWIFRDITDYESVYQYSKEQAPVVGLLSIDNYDDVMRGDDDSSDVVTRLKNVIFNYGKEFGILLRKHRDDTYLLLCNYDSLCRMKEDNFSILDKAREASKDEAIPLTLSIGIAHDFPDVVKLNELASNALDIAMSRGGDQVALSAYGSEMEFIGGKTDAQEKRNRVKTRVLADSLVSLLNSASNVLVMGHSMMDMDALGACLGVRSFCTRLNKQCSIVVDYKNTESKTRSALLSQFNKDELDAIVVTSSNAESRITADTLLVVVDVHIPSMTMGPKLLELASKIVVIDHHKRAEEYIENPVFNHIDPTASSTSEIITEFIRFCSLSPRVELPENSATIMLSGIFLDSSYFKNKRTGVRTFEACTILKEYGANNSIADDLLKDDYEEYQTINELVSHIKTPEYGVCYIVGDNEKYYTTATIAKAANTCLSFKGVHASFVIARTNPREVRMSCRSDGSINVQILAEKLGGGGHFTSSAVTFDKNDINIAEEQLTNVLNKYLKEAQADARSRKDED